MHPRSISREEFARFFLRARPPPGWPKSLVVANSGGPDSTCLLFLIQRFLADSPFALRLTSITVDHALQPSSAAMARQAAANAAALRVPHVTSRVPWGTPPFPPLPDPSQPFEAVARTVRYSLFWKQMLKDDAGALALGHHNDDQVETALMRLGRQSSELGGRGMLMCRRWGMGQANELEWAGYEGMSKWIIRPLLDVPKDRILATCEENELNYVTDSTNFQPGITLRNALRSVLSKDKETPLDQTTLPTEIQEQLTAINKTLSSFRALSIDLYSPIERLRAAIKTIDSFASDVESQVTIQLENCRLASPVGTFILSTHSIQGITNPLLRRAMILRILRYISFQPWGSARAQARRSRRSLDAIIERVWHPSPLTTPGMYPFSAGGGVVWLPVLVDPLRASPNFLDAGGRIKKPNIDDILSGRADPGRGIGGWMAVRQPPYSPAKMAALGLADSLNIDLTGKLRDALSAWDQGRGSGPQIIELLWDCRFLLRFDLAKMPEVLAQSISSTALSPEVLAQNISSTTLYPPTRIAIRWWTKYYLPKVIIVPPNGEIPWTAAEGHEVLVHSDVLPNTVNPLLLQYKPKTEIQPLDGFKKKGRSLMGNSQIRESDWITIRWIRVLDPF